MIDLAQVALAVLVKAALIDPAEVVALTDRAEAGLVIWTVKPRIGPAADKKANVFKIFSAAAAIASAAGDSADSAVADLGADAEN